MRENTDQNNSEYRHFNAVSVLQFHCNTKNCSSIKFSPPFSRMLLDEKKIRRSPFSRMLLDKKKLEEVRTLSEHITFEISKVTNVLRLNYLELFKFRDHERFHY